MQKYGYNVLEAADGAEALSIWQQNSISISLLLTDMVMPGGISGRELADRLTKDNPDLKVIYTSGYSVEFAAQGMELHNGVNFLPKPFESAKLARTIRNSLDAQKNVGQ